MHDTNTTAVLSAPWNHLRGLTPLSLCDWPGRPCCVVFLGGYNLRCPSCHNADLAWNMTSLPVLADFELEQPEAIRQCVRAGLGLGCLSILELKDAFQAGWLAPVSTPFLNLEREFQVIIHRDKHLSPGIRAILALCGVAGV